MCVNPLRNNVFILYVMLCVYTCLTLYIYQQRQYTSYTSENFPTSGFSPLCQCALPRYNVILSELHDALQAKQITQPERFWHWVSVYNIIMVIGLRIKYIKKCSSELFDR